MAARNFVALPCRAVEPLPSGMGDIQVEQKCRVQQQISRHLVPKVSPQSSRWRYRQTA